MCPPDLGSKLLSFIPVSCLRFGDDTSRTSHKALKLKHSAPRNNSCTGCAAGWMVAAVSSTN